MTSVSGKSKIPGILIAEFRFSDFNAFAERKYIRPKGFVQQTE